MPPPSTDKFEITNYDVLADEISNPISSDESDIGLSLAAHSYHVGNNRLEVLCNIHNQAFSDHQAKGDEFNSAAIVEKIMDIVQNQCRPKGRFLERNTKGEWKEVDTATARLLVRQALSTVQNQTSGSANTGDTELDIKKKQEADAEKKRRRRSSLLRRSVSSSMLPNLMAAGGELQKPFDDKKKSTRVGISPLPSPTNSRANSRCNSPVPPAGGRPSFGRSRSVEVGLTSGAKPNRRMSTLPMMEQIIKETMPMDVMFNTAKTALLPGTDLHGNNRLRVMVQIQTFGYQSAKEEEQQTMAEELVKTIENFWGGRVLSKVPSLRSKSDEEYVKLDKENAVTALKNLLSGKAAEKEEEITIGDAPETNVKQGRRASLKAIQSLGGTTEGSSASILPSSLPTLPPDLQHLRSAAVKSLQKRKQRQGLNSRIRGLTAEKAAIFQDGSSNAAVMTAAAGNTSPIPSKIVSNMPNHSMNPNMYRHPSSGASVASSSASVATNQYYVPPGTVQRQGSISNMSTSSSNTSMSMNTMNAARTMANITLGGPRQTPTMMQQPGMMQSPGMGAGGPVLGSELQIPTNVVMPQMPQMMQQMQSQYQQRVQVMMPVVPEELSQQQSGYAPPPLTQEQIAQLSAGLGQAGGGQFDDAGEEQPNRNSLLNSTGSDGLPKFAQGEMEMLIKGLEMAEKNSAQGS